MSNSRREFLLSSAVLLGAGTVTSQGAGKRPPPNDSGSPPAFGTAAGAGPDVTAATFAEAERLTRVSMTAADRAQAAENWRVSMAPLAERRTGPRKVDLPPTLAPYSRWNPVLSGHPTPRSDRFVGSGRDPGPLPASEADIAFAPLWKLARWVQSRQLRSERLTGIYLQRIHTWDPRLRSVITLTRDLALEQARAADREIAAGHYRGPLHGIPWGGKDLLDTAGIRTTYGAEPFKDRVPVEDAAVVRRLRAAGAVLIAKLSLGALALNDVWFGGQTMNPWLLEEGSSGSSAGPGAAVEAGLGGFAIGSETQGSIISPSMRCGVTGLRPTFGRVPRTGAMTLSWTCDKLGPMARSVEDTLLVVNAISGYDASDTGSVPSQPIGGGVDVKRLRVGYIESWMKEAPMTAVPLTLPNWAYGSLNLILLAESAAACEKITLDGEVDQLKMQVPDAWPNTFRQSRFLSAVAFVQADRLRRKVAEEIARVMKDVDLLLVPSLRDEQLVIFNFTGHPSLTLRAGFVEVSEARSDWAPDPRHPLPKFNPPRRVPHGVTLIGRLFDEGTLCAAGVAMERAFQVADERPAGF